MPNEAVVASMIQPWDWCSKTLLSIVGLFVLGSMARTLVSNEPFDLKKFLGEIIFSAIGAIAMYSMGMMQGMNEFQIIGFGAAASLGGVRAIEWMIKIVGKIRSSGVLNVD